MQEEQEKLSFKDRYRFASDKPKKQIFSNNFVGGLAWGVGSILGATIVIGLLGLLIARSRQIPLVGDVVQVVIDEINQGRNSDLFNPSNTIVPNKNIDGNVVSYPTE